MRKIRSGPNFVPLEKLPRGNFWLFVNNKCPQSLYGGWWQKEESLDIVARRSNVGKDPEVGESLP